MTSPVVVALARDRLLNILTPVTEPLLEVLNVRPAALPSVYVSIERDYDWVERITLGAPLTQFRETGTVNAVVNVRSGAGTTEGDTLAEKIRDGFHNYNAGHFHVTVVGSAIIAEPDDGNFLQLKVPVQYIYDFFK